MPLNNLVSLSGVAILTAAAWLLSNDRRRFPWRVALWGLGLQFAFALLLLRTPWGRAAFDGVREVVNRILGFTDAGSSFLWGNLFRTGPDLVRDIGPGPMGAGYWQATDSVTGQLIPLGTVFVIHVLPTIIFFSSLMAVLYHLGIMQRVVGALAWVMRRTMGTSGAESLCCAANIFVGQTEAPLVIRPCVPTLTMSELMAVMVGGFATIAGGVMMVYVRFGIDAGHLLAASVMSAPAALIMAKVMYPERGTPETAGGARLENRREYANVIDAAAGGAGVGLRMAANVSAMLLAFIALVAMINYGLGWLHTSLQQIFGLLFSPFAWVMGVPWGEARAVGNLLGTQMTLNEFVAYLDLAGAARAGALSPRSVVIATYAICGFANFASIAIQIGGIGSLAPGRRADVARLGLRAMFAGQLASWMTAAIAGFLTK
ncbi:MAG: NupC/NupG family nucleoside CNT transporter [Candidatus Krumholzibacteriia bacterium]